MALRTTLPPTASGPVPPPSDAPEPPPAAMPRPILAHRKTEAMPAPLADWADRQPAGSGRFAQGGRAQQMSATPQAPAARPPASARQRSPTMTRLPATPEVRARDSTVQGPKGWRRARAEGAGGLAGPQATAALPATALVAQPAIGKVRDVFSRELLAKYPMQFFIRRLQGTATTWLRSETLFFGTFGRISMGRALSGRASTQQKVAIKETHAADKHGPAADRTLAQDTYDAQTEADRTEFIRQQIEDGVPQLEAKLWPNNVSPLDAVRTGRQKSVVFDEFYDPVARRHYLVTTLELGDAHSLAEHIPLALRPAIVASFVTQGALELAAMHEHAGSAHCDLRLDNISYNGFGQFKLMDFGLARAVFDEVAPDGYAIPYGALAAPELVPAKGHRQEADEAYTTRADHFGFGASAWQLLAGSHLPNPFGWEFVGNSSTLALDVMRARKQALHYFFAMLPKDAAGLPALPRTANGSYPVVGDSNIYDVSALPLISDRRLATFLHQGIRRSPEVAEVLLSLLAPNKEERADLEQVAQRMAQQLPAKGSAAASRIQAFWAEQEARGDYHQVFADADTFERMLTEAGDALPLAAGATLREA